MTTVWVECPLDPDTPGDPICSRPFSSLDFVVNVLPRCMSERFHLRGGVVGLAIEADGEKFGWIAYVFYDVARDLVRQQRIDLDLLLGTTIAHELGHLLLGTNSHSVTGLTSAFWSAKQLIVVQQLGLTFSSADAERVQKAMLARRLAALSTAVTSDSATLVPLVPPTTQPELDYPKWSRKQKL